MKVFVASASHKLERHRINHVNTIESPANNKIEALTLSQIGIVHLCCFFSASFFASLFLRTFSRKLIFSAPATSSSSSASFSGSSCSSTSSNSRISSDPSYSPCSSCESCSSSNSAAKSSASCSAIISASSRSSSCTGSTFLICSLTSSIFFCFRRFLAISPL